MNSRTPFGYVIQIDGHSIRLNLQDSYRGHYASHFDGVSAVTETGSLFGIDGGPRIIVARVRSLLFAEPREAHRAGVGTTSLYTEPLRHVDAFVIGFILKNNDTHNFICDSLITPALGAESFPLTRDEIQCVLQVENDLSYQLTLGHEVRTGAAIKCGVNRLLSRHVAVLGGTGQGKSCYTAAMIQQMVKLPHPRIVIFDINGEYEAALKSHLPPEQIRITTLGGESPTMKIPYYALGRHGLSRLMIPSEKTQRPALMFALEHLDQVEWNENDGGARMVGETETIFFDDCHGGDNTAKAAAEAIMTLRRNQGTKAQKWPHMRALACLVAESHSLKPNNRNEMVRDAFAYGNIAPLITRIHRCVDDEQFCSVIDITGDTPPISPLSWRKEGAKLCEQFFGAKGEEPWKVHIVNLREVVHDLMPLVLGSLLELLAHELFRRGQDGTFPTLLVLEEAHHYLRQVGDSDDDPAKSSLAYERLAKEGRKFGLTLWVSTQRPSEVSSTVLSQCATWTVFRLASEADHKAVAAAGEWIDRQELSRIAGLPRKQAVLFGSGVSVPVRVVAPEAAPTPDSKDPNFLRWGIPE